MLSLMVVAQRQAEADVVQLRTLHAVDAGLATVGPDAVDGTQKLVVKSRVRWASSWNSGSVFSVLPLS